MYVHALHTVHALPDLRVAGGRLGDGFHDAVLFATASFTAPPVEPQQADLACEA